MKVQFWSLGKPHDVYVAPGITDFTKRISNYFPVSWKIIAVPRQSATLPPDDLKKKEGEVILKSLSSQDYLVALDERGRSFTSPQLASFIQSRANESVKELIFLIGGAYGLHTDVLHRANHRWSLSALTFPHQLVRLILAEQVYRACTIIRNEKYHHH